VSGILWLASFPKSGNTWIRAFLANYVADARLPVEVNTLPDFAYGDMRSNYYAQVAGRPAASLGAEEIDHLRPAVHRFLAGSRPGMVFVKTHTRLTTSNGVPTITPDVTAGAIYVVRNPLDVAVSFAHHYGLGIDEGLRALCFPDLQIEAKEGHVRQLIGDWSSHVASWLEAPGLACLMLRYEDMMSAPQTTFGRVVQFLNLGKDRERLKRALRHSSFRVLAEQEQRTGFVERSKNADRFFRRGVVGSYREELSSAQAATMIDVHRVRMTQLGYLAADGRLLV
jgi:Sulfotransferase domain